MRKKKKKKTGKNLEVGSVSPHMVFKENLKYLGSLAEFKILGVWKH